VRAVASTTSDVWVRKGCRGIPSAPAGAGLGRRGDGGCRRRGRARDASGDRVVVGPGLSCGTCPACRSGRDPLCPDFEILGESRDGGCADYLVCPRRASSRCRNPRLPRRRGGTPGVPDRLAHAGRPGGGASRGARPRPRRRFRRLVGGDPDRSPARGKGPRDRGLRREVPPRAGAGGGLHGELRHGGFRARGEGVVGRAAWTWRLDHVGPRPSTGLSGVSRGRTLRVLRSHIRRRDEDRLPARVLQGSRSSARPWREPRARERARHVAAGELRPVVDRVFPLDRVADAHRHLESRVDRKTSWSPDGGPPQRKPARPSSPSCLFPGRLPAYVRRPRITLTGLLRARNPRGSPPFSQPAQLAEDPECRGSRRKTFLEGRVRLAALARPHQEPPQVEAQIALKNSSARASRQHRSLGEPLVSRPRQRP